MSTFERDEIELVLPKHFSIREVRDKYIGNLICYQQLEHNHEQRGQHAGILIQMQESYNFNFKDITKGDIEYFLKREQNDDKKNWWGTTAREVFENAEGRFLNHKQEENNEYTR